MEKREFIIVKPFYKRLFSFNLGSNKKTSYLISIGTILIIGAGFIFLFQPGIACADVAHTQPNGDSTPLQWSATPGGTHYTTLDDGIWYNNPPTITDYISTVDNNYIDVFDMGMIAGVSSVSQVQVWVYCNLNPWEEGGSADVTGNIYMGGTWQTGQAFTCTSSNTWKSITFTKTGDPWTKTDLENMQVKLTSVVIDYWWGDISIYAMYADVTYIAAANPTQKHFRIYQDDAGLNAATAYAAEDTNYNTNVNTNFRIRFEIWNDSVVAGNITRRLEFKEDSGSWTQITTGTNNVRLVDSSNFIDADATTTRLTAHGIFAAGQGKDTGSDTTQISLTGNYYTEDEYSLRFQTGASGHSYQFRITNAGVVLDTYTVTPTIVPNTVYLDPNGDGSTLQWTCTAGTDGNCTTGHYTVVDDGIRQPTAASTSGYISTATSSYVEIFNMATTTGVGTVNQVKVWAYGIAAPKNATCSIYMGSTWQTAQNVSFTGSDSWKSITFTGSWSQTDLDNLQIKFTSDSTGGTAYIYSTYAEVLFSEAVFDQKHFRIYQDDGGLNTANPFDALEDINYNVGTSTNFRIRFEVANTGTNIDNLTRRLEFKEDSGSWTQITTGTNNVRLQNSTNFTDGDATTARLTAVGTFTAGQGKDTGSDTSQIVLTNAYYTEDEYSLKFQEAASGHTYQFRITNAGTVLVTYTNTPTIIPIGNSFDQKHFKIYQDDSTLNAATAYASEDTNYNVQINTRFRIRFETANTGNDEANITRRLEFKEDSGSWTQITTSSNNVRLQDSANFADAAATTARLTATGTFMAGQGKDTGSDTSQVLLYNAYYIEDEYSLKFQPDALTHTYQFRISNAGTALGTYTATPSISPLGAYVDPNGDLATGWSVSPSGTHYTTLDDGTRQPTAPNTGDYISTNTNNYVDTFDMSTFGGVNSVTQVKVWIYCELNPYEGGGSADVTGNIYMNSLWQTPQSFSCVDAAGWKSVSFTGTWTSTDLENMQVKLTSVVAGGWWGYIYAYAMYSEIKYTETANFTQKHFRIYQDDAGLNSATAYAAEDTNYNTNVNTNFRIRFQTLNNSDSAGNITRRLEFKEDSGSWTQITTNSNNVRLVDSTNFTDGDATTARLTAHGAFTAGKGKDTGSDAAQISLSGGYYTEDEYSIKFQPAAISHTYQFRITNSGTALGTYTVTPTIVPNTVYLDPNGDGSTLQWTCTAGTDGNCTTGHYTVVDDGIRQPTAASTSGYISTATSSYVEIFSMATTTGVGTVSQVKVWAYGKASSRNATCSIYMGSAWQTVQNVSFTGSDSWKSITFTGSWSQTDLDNLQIKFTSDATGGTGYIYSTYAEVLFSEAVFDQKHFRIYQDDGGLNSATAYAAEDTNYNVNVSTNFRIRFEVANTGNKSDNATRRLQFKEDSGSWTQITTGTNNVRLVDSINFTDGDATTARLTATGTFVAGQGKDTGSDTSQITIESGYYTEDEYALKFETGAAEHTYQFRISNTDGTGIQTYSQTPTIIPQGAYLRQKHFRIYQDDSTLNAATAYAAEDTNYNVQINTRFRIRFETANTGAAATNVTRRLEFKEDSGSWTQITTGTNNVRLQDSANFTDAAATTARLTATGTFMAGQGKDTGSDAFQISLTNAYYTEDEYSIKFQPDAMGHTYQFRITNAGSTFSVYDATPSIFPVGAYVDPNGDVAAAWYVNPGESSHYLTIDEGTRQPTVPNTGDYIYIDWDAYVDTFDMSSLAGVNSVTQVKVWIYCDNWMMEEEGSVDATGNIYMNSLWQTPQNFSCTGTTGWKSVTFTGTWTKTDLDNMQVKLTSAMTSWGNINVYAMYAEIKYTETANLTQKHFRIYQDNAGLNSATAYAAEDTNYNVSIGTDFRIRFQTLNNSDTAANITRRLEFKEDSGAWTQITTGTNNVRLQDSTNFTDGDATTARLTAHGAFTAGQGKDTGSDTTQISLSGGYYTEEEYSLRFQALASGHTYQFRISNAGTALDTYTVTPSITPSASAAVFNQKHFRIYQDDGGLNTATAYAAEDTNYNVSTGTNFRIRFETANTGDIAANITRRLEFKEDSGAWTQITTGTNNVRLQDSTNFTDADATTARLTTTGTFTAGQGKDTGSDTSQISLTNAYYTEDEYSIKFQPAAAEHSYQFRISNAGAALSIYSYTPTIVPQGTSLYQSHFRIYNDDAGLNSATVQANEDTNINIQINTGFRIRFQTANKGNASINITRRLEFKEDSGAWTQITTGTNNVRLQDSVNFTDADATTARLTATGTFMAGQGKDTGSDPFQISLTNAYYTEDEYSLKFQPDAIDHVYQFRITNASVALDTYTNTPSITVLAAYVDPNGDAGLEWDVNPGGTHYTTIDDGTRQPNTPTTGDYIWTTTSTKIDTFDMSTFGGVSTVTQVKVWAYGKTVNISDDVTASIYVGGSWQTAQDLAFTASDSWKSVTFTGTWTQTDLDNLQVKLAKVNSNSQAYIYSVYAEIKYTETSNFIQKHFRFYQDDAGLNAATVYAAEDTNYNVATGTNFRLRFQILNNNDVAGNITRRLEFKEDSGSWTQITTGTNNVRLQNSSNFTDGDATTARLTQTGAFTAGQGKDTGSDTTQISLSGGYYTEDEYSLRFQSAAYGHTYQFRITNSGTALYTYTVTPSTTPTAATTIEQKHFRIYQDDAGLNTATAYAAEDTNYNVNVSTNFRIRFETAATGTAAANIIRRLQFKEGAGAWTQITTGTNNVRLVDSINFTDGDATTARLTATGTFTAGQGKDTGSDTSQITIESGYYTEDEYALKFETVAAQYTYQFRIVSDSGLIPVTYTVTPSITPQGAYLRQKHFRIYQDDAGLNSATAYTTEDTIYDVQINTNFRIRFQTANTGSAATNVTRRLEFKEDSGSWTQITTGTNNVRLQDSPNFVDAAATTTRLTATGAFTAGQGKDTGSDTSQISLTNAYYTEDEYALKFQAAAMGHTYLFRITNAGSTFDIYDVAPTISPFGAFVDPNGDVAAGWWVTPEESSHYLTIDEGTRQPTVPDTGDYIYIDWDGYVDTFDTSSLTNVSSVTQVKVWIYCDNWGGEEGTTDATGNIYMNSSWQTPQSFSCVGTAGWKSITFTGTWTKTDLDNMQVKLTSNISMWGYINVYAMYAEIKYTETANLIQKHFRIYQDDAGLNSATAYAAEDTNYNVQVNTNFRVRLQTLNSSGTASNITRRLEFKEDSGAWTQITTGTNNVRLVNSSNFTDADATTARLAATGTFTAGQGKDTGSDTTQISLTGSYYTEDEYALKFESAASGHTYQFRISNAGVALDTYTVTPSIAPTAVASFDQKHFRIYQDDAALNSATAYAAEDTNYNLSSGTNFRIRLEVANTGQAAANITSRLEFKEDSGSWIQATTNSGNVRLKDTSNFTDAAATTTRLTATGTFTAGQGKDINSDATQISLTNAYYTEEEYCLKFQTLALAHTYQFRITNAGVALDTYTATPSITVVSAIVDQKHFRIYQDDAALNSATAYAAEDTNYNVNISTNFRIRFETANTGTGSTNVTRRLEFKEDAGAWTQITTGTNNVRLVDSSNFIDGDATTARLTATGTFAAGQGKDTGSDTSQISLTNAYYTEDEYALKFEAAALSKTYQFRITNAGVALDTYTATPSIVAASPTLDQKHFRIYQDDAGLNAATAYAAEDTNYNVNVSTNFRIRFETANTGTGATNVTRRLEFKEDLGDWTQITTGTNNIRLVGSSNFTDGDATTSRLTATGTFTAGQGKDTGSDTTQISLTGSYYTEDEYSLKFQAAAASKTYQFRITNAGVVLDTYTATPSIIPTAVAIFNQEHFRIYDDDAGLNAATALANEDTSTNINISTNFRIRFETANTGQAAGNVTRRLEFKEGAGSWTQIAPSEVDPDGDDTPSQWVASPAGPHYANLDGGYRYPVAGDTSDYIYSTGLGNQDTFTMTTFSGVASISQVKLWVYGAKGGVGATASGDIYINGNWVGAQPLGITSSYPTYNWYSVTFTGNWTQTDLNGLKTQINRTAGTGTIYIAEIYCEITYTGSANVRLQDSANFTDGDATTSRLTATGTFTAGKGKDASSDTTQISLTNAYYTEDEYALKFQTGALGNTYQFRITNASVALDTYTATPSIVATSPTLNQKHFRIYQDDGGLNSATAYAAEDTNYNVNISTNFRIRFETANTGTGATNVTRRLEFKEDAGAWTQITTGTNNVRLVDSSNFTDGDATTSRLTATGTFTAGKGKDTGSDTTQISLTGSYYTEDEYSLKFQAAALTHTYQFRITNAGVALDTYTVTPSIVAASPTLDQKHFRIYQDDAALNSATAYAAEDTNYNVTTATNFRIRFETANTGTGATNVTRRLEFKEDAGVWTQVAATTSTVVFLQDSTNFTDGDATTSRLTATGTFTAGKGKDTGSDAAQISLTGSYYTEDEYSLKFQAAALTHTYQFRITNLGVALDTYTATPSIAPISPFSFNQKHFRIYQDDAGLNAATAYAAEDTNYNIITATNFRVRFEVANTGQAAGDITRRLEFKEDAGAWTQITTGTNNIRLVDSTNFTDGDATTSRLTATGTFTAGKGKDTGSDAAQISLTGSYYTEDEYSLKFQAAAAGKTYQFRITNSGVALNTYTVTPSIIAISTPTVTTSAATSIEETTATGNGNITATNGENADERGVEWGTAGGGPYPNSVTESGNYGTGAFTKNIITLDPGTTYYYRAKAHNSAGWGYGSEQNFVTKPNPPTALADTARTATSISISWTKGSGAEKTMVRYRTDQYPVSVSDGTQAYFDIGSSTTVSTLTNGQIYYFRSWSYTTGAPNSGYSDETSDDGAYTNPGDPASLATSNPTTNSLDLTWTKGTGGDKTMIRRKTGSYPTSVSDGTQAYFNIGSFTTDSTLDPNTTYYYRAWAYDSDSGYYSDSYSQTTGSTSIAVPTITTSAASSVSQTTATLNGNITSVGGENCDTRGFEWGLTNSYGTTWTATGSFGTGAFSYGVTGLSPENTYHFRAKSHNSAGWGYGSDQTFLTSTGDSTPPVISNIATAVTDLHSATITWDTNEAATSQVEYSVNSDLSAPTSTTAIITDLRTKHSVVISGLTLNTTYYYRVKSKDGNDNETISPASAPYGSFTTSNAKEDLTAPVITVSPSAGSITQTGATITWTTDENSTSLVDYGTTTQLGSLAGQAGDSVTSHSVAITGLSANTLYYYQIRSTDSAGNSTVDNNGGLYYNFTTSADSTAPTITVVTAAVVDLHSATITWTTSESATSLVEYSTNADLSNSTSTTIVTDLRTKHSVIVSGLTLNTTYYYRVKSKDAANNERISPASSPYGSFTTSNAKEDLTAPVITVSPSAGSITQTGATITWTTDENSTSLVDYGTTTQLGSLAGQAGDSVTSHSVVLTGLSANTLYYYQIRSTDSAGNSTVDNNGGIYYNFTTSADSTAPTITSVAAPVVDLHSATITWTTSESATSLVEYSTNADLSGSSQTVIITDLRTKHSVIVSGLTLNTTYYYRVKSKDAADNETISTPIKNFTTSNAKEDLTAPVVSSVSSGSITQTGATIAWTTDENSTSLVDYGATTQLGSLAGQAGDSVTSHSVAITGLSANTLYYYQVKSTDSAGNTTTDNNGGAYYTFTATADSTAPTISNVTTAVISDTSVSIVWDTNELSTSQIEYGATDSYGSETTLDSTLTIQHSVKLSGLTANTSYHYRVKSKDAANNTATSSDYNFTTQTSGGETIIIRRPYDTDAPVILNIRVLELRQNSVKIHWTTSEATNTLVAFGETNSYGSLGGNLDELVLEHEVKLSNLQTETTYHYKIYGYDVAGNKGSSDDKTFTTLKEGEIAPPEETPTPTPTPHEDEEENILNKIKNASRNLFVKIIQVLPLNPFLAEVPETTFVSSASEMARSIVTSPVIAAGYPIVSGLEVAKVKIAWVTDKASNSIVTLASDADYDFTKPEPYTIIIGDPDEEVTYHEVEVIGLEAKTLYHYEARSRSKFGEWVKSGDRTFTTLSETAEIYEIKFTEISEGKVVLGWKTTLPTKTTIETTNLSTGEKTTQEDPSYLKEHTLTIKDLIASTNYTVQIFADDEIGNRSFSPILPFTTTLSLNPPVISQVRIITSVIPGKVEKVQAIISWKTDKPSTSRIYFEEGISGRKELLLTTPLDSLLTTDHTVITTAFKSGRAYRLRTESMDASGNVSYSKDYTILTPKPKESILDLIIKNFSDIFGFLKKVSF